MAHSETHTSNTTATTKVTLNYSELLELACLLEMHLSDMPGTDEHYTPTEMLRRRLVAARHKLIGLHNGNPCEHPM